MSCGTIPSALRRLQFFQHSPWHSFLRGYAGRSNTKTPRAGAQGAKILDCSEDTVRLLLSCSPARAAHTMSFYSVIHFAQINTTGGLREAQAYLGRLGVCKSRHKWPPWLSLSPSTRWNRLL